MRYKDYAAIGERVWYQKLENGLTVYVLQKSEYRKTLAYIAAGYGGADRRFQLDGQWHDTPAGVAHFLEHKMFDMKDYNALARLTENGARANAFTSSDMTAYYFECTDRFEENFRTLLHFVSTPYFTQESVDKEQGIIGQEIRMTEDNPSHALYYGLLRQLYGENPIWDSVAGTVESISQITPETLYVCHSAFYTPANMAICVVGNVEPERVAALCREMLPAEKKPVPLRDYGEEAPLPVSAHRDCRMAVGTPLFMMGARCEAQTRGGALLRQLLTGQLAMSVLMGKGSPLYMELYGAGLINDTFAYSMEAAAGTAFLLFGGESTVPNRVCAAVMEAAAELADRGPDGAFLERRRKAMIGAKLGELNSFDNICYNVLYGHFYEFDAIGELQELSRITGEEVRQFIAQNFRLERMAVSTVNGTESADQQ